MHFILFSLFSLRDRALSIIQHRSRNFEMHSITLKNPPLIDAARLRHAGLKLREMQLKFLTFGSRDSDVDEIA